MIKFFCQCSGFCKCIRSFRQDLPQTKIFIQAQVIFFRFTQSPQDESTTKSPSTLYGVAKATAMNLLAIYQKKIIFLQHVEFYIIMNLLRKKNFFKKIVDSAINIKNNKQEFLYIGNLNDQRDWGSAEEYIEAMWLINNLQFLMTI